MVLNNLACIAKFMNDKEIKISVNFSCEKIQAIKNPPKRVIFMNNDD